MNRPSNIFVQANAMRMPLADASVHTVITSPPYWGLRVYDDVQPTVWGGDAACKHVWGDEILQHKRGQVGNHSTLEGGLQAGGVGRLQKARQGAFCQYCGAWRGCLGLEPTPELYVAHMVAIFREVRRVLRDDGTVWLVLGDSYASGKGTCFNPGGGANSLQGHAMLKDAAAYPLDRGSVVRLRESGLKPKDLVGIPWMMAFALRNDGWWLRRDVIWAKGVSFCPNWSGSNMPESVRDRPTTSHEYLFLLSKSRRYFYDYYAVREPCASGPSDIRKMVEKRERIGGLHKELDDPLSKASAATNIGRKRGVGDPTGRNLRSVWVINPQARSGGHFAKFAPKLVEPCVLAGTSARGCCPSCGAPWERVKVKVGQFKRRWSGQRDDETRPADRTLRNDNCRNTQAIHDTIGWRPTCDCNAGEPVPATILDPFVGSGTTVAEAIRLGRRGIGLDLSGAYLHDLATERARVIQPILAGI